MAVPVIVPGGDLAHLCRLAFGDDAEEVVLERFVGGWAEGGVAAALGVDRGGLGVGGAGEIEGAEVGELELDGDCAAVALALQRGEDNLVDVGIECDGDRLLAGDGEVLREEFLFEGEELRAVGSVGDGGVVEGEEECVIVGNPEEVRRLDSVAHGDAVG